MKENNPLFDMRNETVSSGAAEKHITESELKKLRKAALLKMLAMAALIVCIIIFGSVQATTIQMTV